MASKNNEDLFNQSSKQNDGSLPLDFAGEAKKADEPGKEVKSAVSEPAKKEMVQSQTVNVPHISSSAPEPTPGKSDLSGSPRKPIHHVPPPYKKSVQEQAAQTQNQEVKEEKPSTPTPPPPVQEKPPEKIKEVAVAETEKKEKIPVPVAVPATAKAPEPLKEVSTPVSKPVQAAVPAPVQTNVQVSIEKPVRADAPESKTESQAEKASPPVSAPAPAAIPAPPSAPVQSSVQVPVSSPVSAKAPPAEKKEPVKLQPKSKEHKKDEKKSELKTESKPEKQHQPHVSHKKDQVPAAQIPVPAVQEIKPVKHEEHKEVPRPTKKFNVIEKFSSDNATAGQILQEGRVRAGLSFDQAAITTKIKRNFIEALERDDFQNLPAPVYVNAYVRSLCYLYKIDENKVISLLGKAKGKTLEYTVPEEVIHHIEKGKQVNIVQENKVRRITLTLIAACLILVAGIAITYQLVVMNKIQTTQAPVPKQEKNPVKAVVLPSSNLQEQMEKKLLSPHIFTMSQLPLPEH